MTQTLALATEPEGIAAALDAHLNTLDVETALAFYEPDAIMIDADGGVHQGLAAIRSQLKGYFALGLPMAMAQRHLFVAGDTAQLILDWSMTGTAPDGSQIDIGGTAADIARRGADGKWRYVIDNPFGTKRRG